MLPFALEEALVYQGIGENSDGQETVRTACEILSVLWQEVGAENFTEWVSRIYLLVQSKKVLQCSMSEQSEDKGTAGTSSQNIERSKAQSKCSLSSITLCGLWEGLQDRCSSPRWERVQQLTREFGEIVQKLPCEATHTPTILYCLRKTSKGLSALHTSLSTIQSMENKGASNPTENCGDFAESEREREETATDVGTSIDSASRVGLDIYNLKMTGDKACTVTTKTGRYADASGPSVLDTASGFKYRQGAKAGGIGWQNGKGKAPTLCAAHQRWSGLSPVVQDNKNTPIVFEPGIASRDGGHVYKGIAPTLRANPGDNAPAVFTLDRASFNQGRNAQYQFKIGQDEIADTLVAKGPGGGCSDTFSTNRRVVGCLCADDYKGINNQYVADGKVVIDEQKQQDDNVLQHGATVKRI
jgi:hypothetical protein